MYSEAVVYSQNFLSTLAQVITTPLGESAKSNEVSITTTSTGAVKLPLPVLSGGIKPSGWRIYRGTSPGNGTLLTTVSGDKTTFYDDGSYTLTATTPPTAATGQAFYLTGVTPSLAALTSTNIVTSWIDQSFTYNLGTEAIAYNQALAQPFIPTSTYINAIDLPLTVHGTPLGNILVTIYGAGYNTPNTTAASISPTITVPITQVANFAGTGNYTKVTLPVTLQLVPGKVYYIVAVLDTPANTFASGNYVNCAENNGQVKILQGVNTFYYNGNNNLTGAWNRDFATGPAALCYRTYGAGQLSSGTYYYVVTAVTGWATQEVEQRVASTGNTNICYHLFSSGSAGTETIFIAFVSNLIDNYNVLYYYLLEHYDTNSHCFWDYTNTIFAYATDTNNFPINIQNFSIIYNTANVVQNYNVTYRVTFNVDHIFLSIAGDPGSTTWVEETLFLGKITPLSATDKCYVISENPQYGQFKTLRDFGGNAGATLYIMFPVSPLYYYNNSQAINTFPYLNQYTNNYDGITAELVDRTYGVRGTIPNILLYPSAMNAVVSNHSTFIVNGQTYKFYVPYHNLWSAAVNINNVYGITDTYYPAFNMN